jgi:U3 small nucleolar RNA-associated protein 12
MLSSFIQALSIDISSDSTLLISASADKNVKIWGLDFGDCHKSMFAHQDSVMQVRFVKDTHYFFSVGKDRLLKYWDADKFEQILSLSAHQAEVWALAVSGLGDMVVTGSCNFPSTFEFKYITNCFLLRFSAGNDRSIRIWQQTDEQVFVDEERENALEAMFEQGLEKEANAGQQGPGQMDGSGLASQNESGRATRASLETLKAGERLIDSIDLAIGERERMEEFGRMMSNYEEALRKFEAEKGQKSTKAIFGLPVQAATAPTKPAPAPLNPLMLGKTADRFMLHMIKTVRTTDLEEVRCDC